MPLFFIVLMRASAYPYLGFQAVGLKARLKKRH